MKCYTNTKKTFKRILNIAYSVLSFYWCWCLGFTGISNIFSSITRQGKIGFLYIFMTLLTLSFLVSTVIFLITVFKKTSPYRLKVLCMVWMLINIILLAIIPEIRFEIVLYFTFDYFFKLNNYFLWAILYLVSVKFYMIIGFINLFFLVKEH